MRNRLVVAGLGNVGYWTVHALALAVVQSDFCWDIAIVDHDDVDERAVRKGYPGASIGSPKVTAIIDAVRQAFGPVAAAALHPVRAAAQSVPGLFRERDVISCVDSYGDAAFISGLAAGAWQCRASTGRGERAVQCIEVFPPDTATLEDAYDDAAWSLASRHQSCVTGEPGRPLAGAPFPPGMLVGALAVQAYLYRREEPMPYRLALDGVRPTRSDWGGAIRAAPGCCPLALDDAASVKSVAAEVARAMNARPDDILIRWDVPLVRRRCSCGEQISFERYPITGHCKQCSSPSLLLSSGRDMLPVDAQTLAGRTLRSLHAPAGVSFLAIIRDGSCEQQFQLRSVP